jgi:sugar phosphate isomerase/epimerase
VELACSSWSFAVLPFERAADLAATLGFSWLDVGMFAGWAHFDPEAVGARPGEMAREICGVLDRTRLKVSDLMVALPRPTNDPDPAVREHQRGVVAGVLAVAKLVQSPNVTILPGGPQEGWNLERSTLVSADELRRLTDLAAARGVQLSIESHWDSIVEAPEPNLRLLEMVPGLRITLDYSHFVAMGHDQRAIDVLLPYASHVHARQAAPGRLQVGKDEGTIEFSRVVAGLQQAGFAGTVALEYLCHPFHEQNHVDVLTETVKLREDLLRLMRNPEVGTVSR